MTTLNGSMGGGVAGIIISYVIMFLFCFDLNVKKFSSQG